MKRLLLLLDLILLENMIHHLIESVITTLRFHFRSCKPKLFYIVSVFINIERTLCDQTIGFIAILTDHLNDQ